MTRRTLAIVLTGVGMIAWELLFHLSSRPDRHDVQPWLGIATISAIVGGALGTLDSWSRSIGRNKQRKDTHRRDS